MKDGTNLMNNRDNRNLEALAQGLQDLEEKQNKVRLDEFLEYKAIFVAETANTLSRVEIQLLSTRFARRFNIYAPIEVYDVDNNLLFKVPQIMMPLKGVDRKLTSYVDKFRSQGKSEVPKYASEATQGLLAALMQSQKDVSDKGFKTYAEYVASLKKSYAEDKKTFDTFVAGDSPAAKAAGESNTPKGDPDAIQGVAWE